MQAGCKRWQRFFAALIGYLFAFFEAVEPRPFRKRLFDRLLGRLNCFTDGQVANQLIFLWHPEHIRHLAADVVRVRDLPFNPAALVAEGDGGEEDVFDRGGVVLHEIGAVAIGDDAPREHEDHCGGCFADAGFGDGVELIEQRGVVHGDEARRLLVAAGGRGNARLQQLPEVFARDGGGVVFAAVAGAGEDGGEGGHGWSPFSWISQNI